MNQHLKWADGFSLKKKKKNTEMEFSHLDNTTYEHVVSLVIDPVLQHHFIHHRDEDLVL